jgi:HK97 gp10 family phage protein
MNISIKITPHISELMGRLKGDVAGALKAGMIYLLSTIEAKAVKNAPVGKGSGVGGNLARSRTSDVSEDGGKGTLRFTAPYAGYVHEGTGIYGPRKRRIVPTSKKALFWPGAKHPVRSVAGMRPRPFATKALAAIDPQKEYDTGVSNYLRQKGWI